MVLPCSFLLNCGETHVVISLTHSQSGLLQKIIFFTVSLDENYSECLK